MDFEDAGAAADDEGWETGDEMEEAVDDSELTFSRHTGRYTDSRWDFWCCVLSIKSYSREPLVNSLVMFSE